MTSVKHLMLFLFKEGIFINILVFVFIILSVTEILLGISFTESGKITSKFIGDIIFLNSIHIGFTFILLFELRPFQLWKRQYNQSKLFLEYKMILFFVLSFLVLVFLFFTPPHIFNFKDHKIFYNIGMLFFFLYAYYHTVKQHLGLFLEENHTNYYLDKISRNKMNQLDHIFFKCFILISWTYVLIEQFPYFSINRNHVQLSYFLCFIFYILLLYIIFERQILRKKLILLPRLLIYPLLPHSVFATTALASIHGMEYFFVFRRLFLHEEISLRKIFYSLGFLFFMIATMLSLMTNDFFLSLLNIKTLDTFSGFYKIILATFIVFSFLHYWLDGKIFKMRDPLVRKYIAPVMFKSSS